MWKNGQHCICQNCSQWPSAKQDWERIPAETFVRSLNDPVGHRTQPNWTLAQHLISSDFFSTWNNDSGLNIHHQNLLINYYLCIFSDPINAIIFVKVCIMILIIRLYLFMPLFESQNTALYKCTAVQLQGQWRSISTELSQDRHRGWPTHPSQRSVGCSTVIEERDVSWSW